MGTLVETIICDGATAGFKVKFDNGYYIQDDYNNDMLFTTFNLARATAYASGAGYGRDFTIEFYAYGTTVPYSYLQRIDNIFELIAEDENTGELKRYVIEEVSIKEYNHFGYICFDNGDHEFVDKKFGMRRANALRKILMASISKVSRRVKTVSKVTQYSKGINIKFFNTTAELNIVTNSGLMDLNQYRKNKQVEDESYTNCFPFIKTMDKYVTFYSMISKELMESDSVLPSRVGVAKKFRELVLEDLIENWDSYNNNKNEFCQNKPTFHPVFYKLNNKILSNV